MIVTEIHDAIKEFMRKYPYPRTELAILLSYGTFDDVVTACEWSTRYFGAFSMSDEASKLLGLPIFKSADITEGFRIVFMPQLTEEGGAK